MRGADFDTIEHFFCRDDLPMIRAHLHLVDTNGTVVCAEVETAVERSFHWVLRDYPQVDPAMIANWAEEVAHSMQERATILISPQRYAYSALKGKVRDWMRSGAAREQVAGIGRDLESIGGLSGSFLGTTYSAAAKAIQRVKERLASTLTGARKIDDPGHGSPQFCETKG
jgi:hypothetical protein